MTISDDRIPGSPTLYNCAKHQFLELARLPAHWICVVEVFQPFGVDGSVVVACWWHGFKTTQSAVYRVLPLGLGYLAPSWVDRPEHRWRRCRLSLTGDEAQYGSADKCILPLGGCHWQRPSRLATVPRQTNTRVSQADIVDPPGQRFNSRHREVVTRSFLIWLYVRYLNWLGNLFETTYALEL